MTAEQSLRAEDVVDRLRIICDECVRVVPHRKLEVRDGLDEFYLALECHDGPRVAVLRGYFVAKMRAEGAFTVLRSSLSLLDVKDLEQWYSDIENRIVNLAELQAELEKAMKG